MPEQTFIHFVLFAFLQAIIAATRYDYQHAEDYRYSFSCHHDEHLPS
jgi:hypothetical protein